VGGKLLRRVGLLSLLFILSAPAAFALDPSRAITQYGHSVWTVQEGFLPGAPTDMTQTADGYLWIGTRSGLVRFDGVRFVPFTPPPGERLRSNRILSLGSGRDGSLWIGTRSGLHRYHRGQLTFYADAPGWIMSILEDRTGKMWFTRSSINDEKGPLCEVQGDRVVCHGAAAGVSISNGRQLSKDAAGNFWAVSDNTLMRWNAGKARTWLPPGISETDGGKTIDVLQSVAVGTDGSIWVGATQPSRGLGLLHLVNDELQPFVTPGLDGRKLAMSLAFVDPQNVLWVGTQDEGLYRVHEGTVTRYRARDGLSGDTVQNLFQDREGTLWVLTTRGIDAFRDLRIVSVTSREGLSADLANAVLAGRDGTVWVNAWHSLDILRDGKITSLSSRNGLPGQEVTALFEDRAGTLWIGVDRDLTVFENGKFSVVRRPDGSPFGTARGLAQDASGDLWVITANPFLLTRIRDRKVVEEIPRTTIRVDRSIVADPREGVWVGQLNGDLGRYRGGKVETIGFHREPASGAIFGLVAHPDGSILGSTSLGLIGWREGKAQTMTATTNGLPCDEIYTVLVDRHGALWLYAACGIVVIPGDQVEAWWKNASTRVGFRVFDALDGAQPAVGNFFPRSSVGPDGRLWFANASVVQVIDPERLGGNTLPPPVQIEQVRADRTSYPVQKGLRLPPNTRDLQIDYTGLSLVVPRKTRFRYRLEGHDTEWQDVGTRRQAFYTDLPPRDYVFQVTASNNDGVWNQTGASLAFSVAPTFYQTRMFVVLVVLAVLGAVWLLYVLRVRQIEARVRMRAEERIEERERIARELHDTLLQGLLSASLQLSVANSKIQRDAPAKPLIERILQLLRQAIDEGRDAVRGLRTQDDALERAFAQIPQDLGLDEKAPFRLVVEGTPRALRPAVRDEVYRIGREALANAFRHAQASSVETVLEYGPDRFRMVVRDNGRGMDPDVLQSGRPGHWGLSGMRERAGKIGARLKVLSAPGAGTEIDLVVPAGAAFQNTAHRRWTDWLGRLYQRSERE
jgi:signal transduction histidine kinase/ligand-binding sensor domain-containing protein